MHRILALLRQCVRLSQRVLRVQTRQDASYCSLGAIGQRFRHSRCGVYAYAVPCPDSYDGSHPRAILRETRLQHIAAL
jgi:hypothetical protein